MDPELPVANIVTFGVADVVSLRYLYGRHGWRLVLGCDEVVVFERRGALFGADGVGATKPCRNADVAASAARSSSP